MSDEKKLLEESRRERLCRVLGHAWDEITAEENSLPSAFVCRRCEVRLAVKREDAPKTDRSGDETVAGVTLIEFLLARIAEDEEIASGAVLDDGGEDGGFEDAYGDLICPPSGVGIAQGGFGEAVARMISTYAVPRRVLAECEAKRRIVEQAEEATSDRWAVIHEYCCSTAEIEEAKATDPGTLILKALAYPHADHPDYREEWRP